MMIDGKQVFDEVIAMQTEYDDEGNRVFCDVLERKKVQGGWLIRSEKERNFEGEQYTYGYSICFMPDIYHNWKINKE